MKVKQLLKKQALLYLICGGAAYVCEFAALFTMHQLLGFSPTISVAVSFWVGFLTAFFLQKQIAFKSRSSSVRHLGKQTLLYGLLVAFNFGITELVVHIGAARVSVYILRTLLIVLTTIWNYAIYKTIIFKKEETPEAKAEAQAEGLPV